MTDDDEIVEAMARAGADAIDDRDFDEPSSSDWRIAMRAALRAYRERMVVL